MDDLSLKTNILKVFPGLNSDPNFNITSKVDVRYNCIAWAANYNDRWMWPPNYGQALDGVWYYWPDPLVIEPELSSFINAFEKLGYELCKSSEIESYFIKIAIYIDPITQKCTHAARQKRNGLWTSKLGRGNDISHSNPESICGKIYGDIACFMKKKFI